MSISCRHQARLAGSLTQACHSGRSGAGVRVLCLGLVALSAALGPLGCQAPAAPAGQGFRLEEPEAVASAPSEPMSPGSSTATMSPDAPKAQGEAQAVRLPADVDQPPPVWEGPLLSIRVEPCEARPGQELVLTANLVTREGQPAQISPPARYTWELPEGWKLEGDGATVKAVVSPEARGGESEVRLRIEDGAGQQVRGGVGITITGA